MTKHIPEIILIVSIFVLGFCIGGLVGMVYAIARNEVSE